MKSTTSIIVIAIIATAVFAVPISRSLPSRSPTFSDSNYVLVGGQNGTWFGSGQTPRLEQVDLSNDSVTSLIPAPTEGTVWGGGWNGTQWLVSGWGDDYGPNGSDPYIFLYNGFTQIDGGSIDQYQAESTWRGGDIFAASYNGSEWLVSGLGSGNLSDYGPINHMALALFNGERFTDLSASVPNQNDAILYANAWNGRYWLVGGGFKEDGILFKYDGAKIINLTPTIAQAVPTFSSVQSIAWNGNYWLIGGVNFLAKYDGYKFTDLTNDLSSVADLDEDCCGAVNAVAWNGDAWLLGGGLPVAQRGYSRAWLAEYSAAGFTDLTSGISTSIAGMAPSSSVLSITNADGSWVIGGYSGRSGSLYVDAVGSFTNLSRLVTGYTYVDWVGVNALPTYDLLLFEDFRLPLPQSNSSQLAGELARLSLRISLAAAHFTSRDVK